MDGLFQKASTASAWEGAGGIESIQEFCILPRLPNASFLLGWAAAPGATPGRDFLKAWPRRASCGSAQRLGASWSWAS